MLRAPAQLEHLPLDLDGSAPRAGPGWEELSFSAATRSVYDMLLRSFARSLRARNRSPRTVQAYLESAKLLAAHAGGRDLDSLTRADIEDFLADQLKPPPSDDCSGPLPQRPAVLPLGRGGGARRSDSDGRTAAANRGGDTRTGSSTTQR